MAAPTEFRDGTPTTSKTADTSLASGFSSTAYAANDIVVASLTMKGVTGAVSFAKTAGTSTIGSWNNVCDVSNFTNVRTVISWALVTGAGTVQTVTATYPSVTPKVVYIQRVTGADTTTPIWADTSGGLSGSQPVITVPSSAPIDVLAVAYYGVNQATGTQTPSWSTSGTSTGWSSSPSGDSVYFGTTGGSTTSNVCLASGSLAMSTAGTAPSAGTLTITPGTSTNGRTAYVMILQPPTGGGTPTIYPAVLINA